MAAIEMNLVLHTHDTTAALRAWDILSRTAAGFAFDDIHAELSIDRVPDDLDYDCDDPEPSTQRTDPDPQ